MPSSSVVLSGMRSTGKTHLGNYLGAIRNWVALQDRYRCYYFVADWSALASNYREASRIARNSLELAADWLAAGLDPERSVLFVQSMVPEHAELHLLLSMLTPRNWLGRVSVSKGAEGGDLSTYGVLGHAVLQTADILLYRADLVPVGEDQLSDLEMSREITRRFNSIYDEVFPLPKGLFSATPRVPGLDGRMMSSSYGNTIDLGDTPEEIRRKCDSMATDRTRLARTDPGHPEACNLFDLHRLVSSEALRSKVSQECRLARIGCPDDKKLIAEQLISYLEPIRERRQELISRPDTLYEILRQGSRRARERARETMESVRSAMGLDYRKLFGEGR